MPNIVAICGSVRAQSFNAMLLRAAIGAAPAGASIEAVSIKDVPLYNGDDEAASGIPAAVEAIKHKIAASDALLLVTPEYNNSIPGVFKNAIDWMSRPPTDIPRVFGGRIVGVIGATIGSGGTGMAQAAWLPVLRTLGTLPFFGARLLVSGAAKVFDADGSLVDATVRGQLEKYMARFAEFITRHGVR